MVTRTSGRSLPEDAAAHETCTCDAACNQPTATGGNNGRDGLQSRTSSLTSDLSGAAGSAALTSRGARLTLWADLGLFKDAVVNCRARGIPWIVAAKLIVIDFDRQCG